MIKLRNKAEFLVDLSVPGTQSAANDKAVFLVPFASRLKAIYAKLGTAGVTGNQDVSVKKNGVSILNSTGGIRFATGSQDPNAITLTADPTSFAKGDVVTVDVAAIHTTPAKNLGLLLVFERQKVSGAAATTTTGVGPENE